MTLIEFLRAKPSTYAILKRADELYRAWPSQAAWSGEDPPPVKLSMAASRTNNLQDPQWMPLLGHARLFELINNPNWEPEAPIT